MNKKKLMLIFALLISALIFIVIGSYVYIQYIIEKPYNIQDISKREFVIKEGDGVMEIASNLENSGFIAGKDFFNIYILKKNLSRRLQAGSYALSPSMTISHMVDFFVVGKIKGNEILITIPEGFSNEEIDKRLAEKDFINEGEFINFDKILNLDLLKYNFLNDKPLNFSLQGYYFPDTYKYYDDSSIEDIVKKMFDNFDLKLTNDLREEIKKQNKTIFEVIVLASIVEKEAGHKDDMKKISSVFQNRLEIGKALESDATINYITNSGRAQSTYEDLKVESPYNTYKYSGLPPGPISNPGIDAIKAVIYYEKTDYFYFLTKKDDNMAVFSKTYQEHLKNKNKYLK